MTPQTQLHEDRAVIRRLERWREIYGLDYYDQRELEARKRRVKWIESRLESGEVRV